MKLNKLTALQVAHAQPGRYGDGGGLALFVSTAKDGTLNKKWVFRYSLHGKPNEMGLGGRGTTLREARAKAIEARRLVRAGIDPVEAKRDAVPKPPKPTFGKIAAAVIAKKSKESRNAKHREQWRVTLETLAKPLWDVPVDQVDTQAVLDVLKPIWLSVPETASRLRGRIEAVLNYAKALKLGGRARTRRHGAGTMALDPAQTREAFARPPCGNALQGHSAIYGEAAPTRNNAVVGLQFLILTAARAGEVLGTRWDEIDLDAKVWTIPATRMKAAIEHRVPLSSCGHGNRRAQWPNSVPVLLCFPASGAARRFRTVRFGP